MSAFDEFQRLDAISRERALEPDETHRLWRAMQRMERVRAQAEPPRRSREARG